MLSSSDHSSHNTFGWERMRDSYNSSPLSLRSEAHQFEGPSVFYPPPFDVHSDADGMKIHLTSEGEERMRPLARISCVPKDGISRAPFGLLENSWMHTPTSAPERAPSTIPGFNNNDGEYHKIPSSSSLVYRDWGVMSLSDRNLVIRTEKATLYLGG